MYNFLIRPSKDNKLNFISKDDEDIFYNILDDAGRRNITLEITVQAAATTKKSINENQKNLWKFLITRIAEHTGDAYSDTEYNVLFKIYGTLWEDIIIDEFNNGEFTLLVNRVVEIANDIGMKLKYNEEKGRFEW